MSATDHLSNVQFMHVDEIGAMHSADFPQVTMAEYAADPWKAAREHPEGPHAERYSAHEWSALESHIDQHGVRDMEPLHIGEGEVLDGHHRYRAAIRAGHTHLPVVHEHDALEAAVGAYHANRGAR